MFITIDRRDDDKYPSFVVNLHSKEGVEPFLSIKNCRVVEGHSGRFVSWPAKKDKDGKYWRDIFASEAFQVAIIDAYDNAAAKKKPRQSEAPF